MHEDDVRLRARRARRRLAGNTFSDPRRFFKAVEPFGDDLVVAAECMFAWYWLADICERTFLDGADYCP